MGTGREVIARILAQMVSAGHIKTGRGVITINEPEKLAELMQHDISKHESITTV